jgi:uncharacterized membrane protein YqaE (UPF0057 family)
MNFAAFLQQGAWEVAFILNMITTVLLAVALYRHLESHHR